MLSKIAAGVGAMTSWYNGMDVTNLPHFGEQEPVIKESIVDGKKFVGAYFPNWS